MQFAAPLAALGPKLEALPKSPMLIAWAIIDGIREHADELVHTVGLDMLKAQGVALWDKYGVPADIPGIPDVMEPAFVDVPARAAIVWAIQNIHDLLLHRDPPAFVPEVGPMNPPVPADESGASA